MMKNLWIQTENAFVTWRADFTAVATQPVAILEFMQSVLVAGAKHQIFEVVEAPVIGYQRARDGALDNVLEQMLKRERVLDLFGFTGAAMLPGHPQSSTVEARVCHYDRDGHLVDRVVSDLGTVLESLDTTDLISNGFKSHYPAVRITGRRYVGVRNGAHVDSSAYRYPVACYIAIHSDVWFPWIFGSAHPHCDYRRMFDNRELAGCHTPRLNAFLGEVAAAARRAGGSFGVWPDESGSQAITCVDDQSVLLDWQPPSGIMPPDALNAEWV